MHKKGPLASIGARSAAGFIQLDSDGGHPYPDIQIIHNAHRKGDTAAFAIHAGGASYNEEVAQHLLATIQEHSIMSVLVTLAHPKSRGRVTLKSNSYQDAPIMDANYFAEAEDVDKLVSGLQYMDQFIGTSAFQDKNAEVIQLPLEECNAMIFKSEEYWRCYLKYMSTSNFHTVGTAKMGPCGDKTAVVNPRLQVQGVDNLRVVDASIMPLVTSVNTNGPTLMIAEKAADIINEDMTNSFGIAFGISCNKKRCKSPMNGGGQEHSIRNDDGEAQGYSIKNPTNLLNKHLKRIRA